MIIIDGIISVLQKSGGISVCFDELLLSLKKGELDYRLIDYGSNLAFDSSNIPSKNLLNRSKRYSSLLRYFDVKIPKGKTVFHSSYYRLPKNNSEVRVVTTVHDFVYERYMGGIGSYLHQWQKKKAVLGSDIIICISESTKADLIEFIPGAKNKDIRVIYNGVSPSFFRENQVMNINDKILTNEKFILYVGSRTGYKNFGTLVQSLKRLTEFKLVFVGGGSLNKLESSMLEQHLFGRYTHHEFVTTKDLNGFYNNAFCFIYPSLYEGFGIPAIEAMQAGCPVIAMNRSSLPEVCGEAAILLDNLNEKKLLESLELLKIPAFRNEIVTKGYKNAKRFSWEMNTKQILSIYAELLGEK